MSYPIISYHIFLRMSLLKKKKTETVGTKIRYKSFYSEATIQLVSIIKVLTIPVIFSVYL